MKKKTDKQRGIHGSTINTTHCSNKYVVTDINYFTHIYHLSRINYDTRTL